ncbi:hypothetical protein SCHPADRAFT_854490 [Schizopora paradoxa]|uniref:Large ribosomal subunit protein mL46 n=1 Tax=Schizopora paradoxa TaxID=27342 RepID=A0A0H2RRC0_9AGAM|nr:hypothetical protein SCHPADRAFT_854490 [Schizopora paradoxa]
MSASVFVKRCQVGRHEQRLGQNFARSLATHAPQKPRLAVAVVLNRAPIIAKTPTKFERAFYKYQARIQRALHNPFPYDFYFKPGSILEQQFNKEERIRERKAFGKDFVTEESSSSIEVERTDEDEVPAPRRTSADETKDVKDLNRQGSRNLYLLVRDSTNGKDEWRFPKGNVESGELLHEAARKQLTVQCGDNMNTWIVGRRPIGFFEEQSGISTDPLLTEKTFFLKGHIFAGQAQTQDSISDFAWLTKQEIESRVPKDYWLGTKDMLSDL